MSQLQNLVERLVKQGHEKFAQNDYRRNQTSAPKTHNKIGMDRVIRACGHAISHPLLFMKGLIDKTNPEFNKDDGEQNSFTKQLKNCLTYALTMTRKAQPKLNMVAKDKPQTPRKTFNPDGEGLLNLKNTLNQVYNNKPRP